MPLKKYLDYDGLAYLLQRFPKTTVHCTFDSEFAGETATLTHGTTTYTKTVPATSPYELTFAVNELGTWTLQSSYLGTQYSDTVDITYLGQKGEIELTIVPDGSTAEPINSIPVWLKCANLNKSYTTLEEVLSDTETYETLLADGNACQYMKRSTEWAGNSENLVPIMTSATTPSGVVSAESYYSAQYAEYFAFNGSISNNGWTPNASATVGNTWIQYQFSEPTVISGLASFQYFPSSSTVTYRKKTTFKIQGSNNGTNFVDLGTDFETAYNWNIWSYSSFENNTAYEYYRIVMTAVEGTDPGTGPSSGNGYKFKLYVGGITTDQDAMARLGKFDYASNLLLSETTWKTAIVNSDYFEDVLNVKVPKMTSATTPSGTVITSSVNASYPAWQAFDSTPNGTFWATAGGTVTNAYLGYDFGTPVKLYKMGLINSSYPTSTSALTQGVKDFEIRGSDDLSTWDTVYTGTASKATSTSQGFEIFLPSEIKEHRYWVIFCKNNYGEPTNIVISQLQFYGRTSEEVLVPLVPTMTSNTTPSGECITSGSDAYKAFDGSDSTYASMSYANDAYVGYHSTAAKIVNKIAFIADPSDTCVFAIDGSNDGTNWIEIDTITGSTSTLKYADITNNTAYSYHRLRIKQKGSESWSGFIVKTLQFYEKTVQTNIIHSTPNDTIYMLEDGDPIVLATTNSDGDGILDFSQLSAGPITLYSSVAKNPEDLTADYSNTITITKTQYGGTTEAYLMPDTIKTLYWWGYEDNFTICNSSDGWSNWGSSSSSWGTVTRNTNSININAAANIVTAVGNKNPISGSKAHAIGYANNTTYAYFTIQPTKAVKASYQASAATSFTTSNSHIDITYDFTDAYITPQNAANSGYITYLYAFWYE